jgi:hypothetical protein
MKLHRYLFFSTLLKPLTTHHFALSLVISSFEVHNLIFDYIPKHFCIIFVTVCSMLQELGQITKNQFIFLSRSDFHKIDQLVEAKDITFEMNFSSKSSFFSK